MKRSNIYFKVLFVSIFLFLLPHNNHCLAANQSSIAVIVSENIFSGIDSSLHQFRSDLENEGYSVIIKTSTWTTPEEVRLYLQNLKQTAKPALTGAVLIGSIPYAYQSFPMADTLPPRSPTDYTCISYQFYSDLDGIFEKQNPKYPDYYSSHTGNTFPEIWISVLPIYQNDINESIIRINSYFRKNHEYRTGRTELQNGFLYIDEFLNASDQAEYDNLLSAFKTGSYSWNPLTTWGNVNYIVNNQIGLPEPQTAYTQELSKPDYTFAVLAAHGTETSNGQLTTGIVKRIKIKPAFLWLEGCSTGNIDTLNNILEECVYSLNSGVLIAKGGTTSAGGLGTSINGFYGHNIAEKLLDKNSLGEAVLYHLQDSLIYPWSEDFELHHAPNIFIGDLSLTLFPEKISDVEQEKLFVNNYSLLQNYPNPFNPVTVICYTIPQNNISTVDNGITPGGAGVFVQLKVYDILGKEIAVLVNKEQNPGNYKVNFDAGSLSGGMYIYVLRVSDDEGNTSGFVKAGKMMLIR